jgi:hypothetical protein
MIYSEAFDAIPVDIRRRIYRALEKSASKEALKILKDTKPDVL